MGNCLRCVCASAGSVVLFIGIIGCGGGPATVSGTVTYKGAPVTGGSITLHFDGDKPPAGGSIDGNGKYAIQSTTLGKASVSIETESQRSMMPKQTDIASPKDGMPPEVTKMPGGGAATVYVKIPEKYSDAKRSGLTWDVKSGQQTKNWELTD